MRFRCYIPAIGRWLATALLALWLFPVLSICGGGRIFSSGTPLILREAMTEAISSSDSHSILCHCLGCPGGALCCCKHGKTVTDSAVFRSVCDRETPAANPPMALPDALLPVSVASPVLEIAAAEQVSPQTVTFSVSGRSELPVSPPPRLS